MIDRSVEGNRPQLDEVDFEKINRLLDVAETAMLSIAAEHHLRETQIQRWRWDQPEVLISWAPLQRFPTVGKNIRVLAEPEDSGAFRCSFESNAWADERQGTASFVRFWEHFPVGTISIVDPGSTSTREGRSIQAHVEKAYEEVSDLRDIRLGHAIFISSDGETREFDGSFVISQVLNGKRGNGMP